MHQDFIDHRMNFFQEDGPFYELSKVYHEHNLHSLVNATDVGFLDLGRVPEGPSYNTGDYEDPLMSNPAGRIMPKEEMNSFVKLDPHASNSPMRYIQKFNSNMGFNPANFSTLGNFSQRMPALHETSFYKAAASPGVFASHDYSYNDYHDPQAADFYGQGSLDAYYNQSYFLDTQANSGLNLMWSNDAQPGNPIHYDLQPSPQVPQQRAINKAPISNDQDLFKTNTKQAPFRAQQEIESFSNKAFDSQLYAQTKIENSTSGPRRTARTTTKTDFTALNEYEESESEEDKDDGYGESKGRSSRGLRVLSQRVREIVSKKKKTSYKEVADALLEDLSQKMKGKSQSEIVKEEQNVKRRVYDALNVLIAADLLRKEGKLVCCSGSKPSKGGHGKKQNPEKETMRRELEEAQNRRKEKLDNLQKLVYRSLALKNLIRRNQEKQQSQQSTQEDVKTVKVARMDPNQDAGSLKPKNDDVIHFPFIVFMSSSAGNNINLRMSPSHKELDIESTKEFEIYGDIDILFQMKLHNVPKDVFQREVPKELQKYMQPMV